MSVKARAAIKELFVSGYLEESDFVDFADSHFNLVDDRIGGSLLEQNSIGISNLTSSVMSTMLTPIGLDAWSVDLNGNFLPAVGHFQDIGSTLDPLSNLYTDELNVNTLATLPANTYIGLLTPTELSYVQGATSNLQQQINTLTLTSGGTVGYTHNQTIASDIWTVSHNKGSEQLVYLLIDNNKYQIMPSEFKIVDINTVEFTFSVPITGKVNIIFY